MELVERLGFKTLANMYAVLDNNDIMEWAAYDLTKDDEWLKEYKAYIAEEQRKEQPLEAEADMIRTLFLQMGNNK